MNRQHTPAVSSETKLNNSESGRWADTMTGVLCCWLLMVPLLRLLPLVVATMNPLVLANPNVVFIRWLQVNVITPLACRVAPATPANHAVSLHPILSRCCLESRLLVVGETSRDLLKRRRSLLQIMANVW